MTEPRYTLVIAPTVRRQLTEHLPDSFALAAYEFVMGALLDNPQRVGKRLHAALADRHAARRGTYRVIYRIDEPRRTVTVLAIVHRADASQLSNGSRRAGRHQRAGDGVRCLHPL